MFLRHAVAVCAFSVAVLLAAPALAAEGKTSGRITLDGKPLAAGKITLHRADGQFVGAKIKDGLYSLDRVPAGDYSVAIEGPGVPKKYGSEETSALTYTARDEGGTFDIVLRGE